MSFKESLQPLTSRLTLLSATQIWVWWTPDDPSFKQRMKKYWKCGWFWQQVAKFVFNVSNLLFSQVSALQRDTDKQW